MESEYNFVKQEFCFSGAFQAAVPAMKLLKIQQVAGEKGLH